MDWNEFLKAHKAELGQASPYETMFVKTVLARIPDINPERSLVKSSGSQ